MPFQDMAAVRVANREAGQRWFSADTMAWWDSQIESGLQAGQFFITSEQMDRYADRTWSVRYASDDGKIHTVTGPGGEVAWPNHLLALDVLDWVMGLGPDQLGEATSTEPSRPRPNPAADVSRETFVPSDSEHPYHRSA